MTYRDQLVHLAVDNYGLVTTSTAAQVGVPAVELRKLAGRGFLERTGYGVYRVGFLPRPHASEFAEAVALVGPGAYLRGDAVLALLDLAPVNPRAISVGVPLRTRKQLPRTIRVVRERHRTGLTEYEGIPSTTVMDAILDCRGVVMDERLLGAVTTARQHGLVTAPEAAKLRRLLRQGRPGPHEPRPLLLDAR